MKGEDSDDCNQDTIENQFFSAAAAISLSIMRIMVMGYAFPPQSIAISIWLSIVALHLI
jgi:hypothetical protein